MKAINMAENTQLERQLNKVEDELSKLSKLMKTHGHLGYDGSDKLKKILMGSTTLTLLALIVNGSNGIEVKNTGTALSTADYCRITASKSAGKIQLYANFPSGAAVKLAEEA